MGHDRSLAPAAKSAPKGVEGWRRNESAGLARMNDETPTEGLA